MTLISIDPRTWRCWQTVRWRSDGYVNSRILNFSEEGKVEFTSGGKDRDPVSL